VGRHAARVRRWHWQLVAPPISRSTTSTISNPWVSRSSAKIPLSSFPYLKGDPQPVGTVDLGFGIPFANQAVPYMGLKQAAKVVPFRSLSDEGFVARPTTHPSCRKCGAIDTRRSHRRLWEKPLSSFILPFRCQVCGTRFWKTRFALRQK
jgi:hypothetical protein